MQSANVPRYLGPSPKRRYQIHLYRLPDLGIIPTDAIVAYIAREEALRTCDGFWIGAGRSNSYTPHGGF